MGRTKRCEHRPLLELAALCLLGLAQARPQDDDCALYLDHRGPSFNGLEDDRCITWSSVEGAWEAAREKVGLRRPLRDGAGGPLARALLGTALQEATRLLTERYSLTREEVRSALPRLDTRRTSIAAFCPAALATNQPCTVARFRRYDGRCNNLRHPTRGAAGAAFRRLLLPEYADGVSAPRASRAGFPLPNARSVSAHVHRAQEAEHHEHAVTLMFVAWGQLVDHDITLTAETKVPETRADPDCCGNPTERRHPNCLPVAIPPGDEFYRRHGQRCMNVVRSLAGVRDDCRLGPRAQFNLMTSYIDAGFLYGSNDIEAHRLRSGRGGELLMQDSFSPLGLKPLLPFKRDFPDEGCLRPDARALCFLAGDNRANEQLVLTALHTALVREHNRLAHGLAHVNPHWGDERLYQEARHIMAAIIQHVTYSEFLPMLLGRELTRRYGLVPLQHGFYDGYDPEVDATVTSAFVTAAFRFGHSLLPSRIERWSASHRHVGSQRLSEVLKQPFDLLKPGWMDQYLLGLVNQPPQAMDTEVTKEVTNHLFQKPTHDYGMDLASINVQRAREHGVQGYAAYRRMCGLSPADRWAALADAFRNGTLRRYHELYEHPEDVDLWSAGVSEKPEPGTMLGATFACLVAQVFRDLRRGDRFWYENTGWPSSFTPAQLQEIRGVKLSRMLCDNADEMLTVQVYVMALPDPESNPRVACRSGVLPRIDLHKWKEIPRSSQPVAFHRGGGVRDAFPFVVAR